jgi:hypothetical protein
MNKIFGIYMLVSKYACTHRYMKLVFLGIITGDIGIHNYVAPNEPALELLYKWNKSQDMLTVFPVITSNDLDSKENRRQEAIIMKIMKYL